jgi:KDO2-lipid IV(A) lauroyltransferase
MACDGDRLEPTGDSPVTEWLQFALAWALLKFLGALSLPLARRVAAALAAVIAPFQPRLRRTAMFNLRLAFPDWTEQQRRATVRKLVKHLGWMAAEFAHIPRFTRESMQRLVALDGFENYAAAESKGQGVIFFTGHTGAWEIMPIAFSLLHHPIYFLARRIANSRVNRLIESYRCATGNRAIDKNQSARIVFRALREGASVGFLGDHNTMLEEAVYVPFFGIQAATTSGAARLAMRTGAAVLPSYMYWDEILRKHRLRFEPAVPLARTGDEEADVRENTVRFTQALEQFVRAHPEQWLWMHKRWKNRPPGEKPIYPF